MLMLADRKDHVEKVILPNLEAGNWVISDRFMESPDFCPNLLKSDIHCKQCCYI